MQNTLSLSEGIPLAVCIVPERVYTVFTCKACGQPLGESDGESLIVGAVLMRRTVTLGCRCCGREIVWSKPRALKQDKIQLYQGFESQ